MGFQAHTPADEDLVSAAQRGDRQAFGQLVERYQDQVYDLSCRTLGDPTRAQDVAQEAFIRAWRAISSFKGQSKFSSWLYRIAVNCSFSELRRRAIPADVSSELDLERSDFPSLASQSFVNELEKQDLVEKLLRSLAPVYRSIVVLHYLHGLSCEEISGITERPVGTVKAYLHRARARLRSSAEDLLQIRESA